MAATAYELTGTTFTVGNTGLSGKRPYLVVGATTDDEAYATARLKAIADGNGDYFGIPIGNVSGDHLGGNVYRVEINYDPAARTEAGPTVGGPPATPFGTGTPGGGNPATGSNATDPMAREWSLSTGGGTKHIIRSRRTVSTTLPEAYEFDAGYPRPDFKKLIGFNEGNVEGVDIIAPDPQIRVSRKLQQLTLGYFLTLCRLTGTTNNGDWKGVSECEMLFVGADANFKDGDGWNVTWSFKYSPTELGVNVGGQAVGGDITVPIKRGWHYLWCAYQRSADETLGKELLVPWAAMVEEVYEPVDFDRLGI